MASISNKTDRPLRVPLPRGKVLHLGPRMSGEIAPSAVTHPPLAAMLEAGTIEVVAEGQSTTQRGPGGGRPGRMPQQSPASGPRGRRSGDR
jgi:hypothetical protein